MLDCEQQREAFGKPLSAAFPRSNPRRVGYNHALRRAVLTDREARARVGTGDRGEGVRAGNSLVRITPHPIDQTEAGDEADG